jgi:hypothetical protein
LEDRGIPEEGPAVAGDDVERGESRLATPPSRHDGSFALRLAAEFVVIVVGVLVALGVESWAQDRRDRAQETEYLARLLDDVRFDLAELALVDSVSRVGLETSRRISTPAVVDTMAPSRVVSAVFVTANVRVPDLSRATFQELINSGQIELIRSDSVRRALASYDRTITELSGGWNLFAPGLRRWYAARIPQEIHQRFAEAPECSRGSERRISAFPVPCTFDLGGWSPEGLRAEVRAEAGQRIFRMAGHNYAAHAFFTSLLQAEARELEAVLAQAVAGR